MTRFLSDGNIFYHGTYSDFVRFHPLSHFGSIYAAKTIVDVSCQKANMQSAGLSDEEIEKKIRIIPAKLHLHNTYELQDIHATHDKEFYRGMLLYHLMHDLNRHQLSSVYDYIAKDPFLKMRWDDVKKELQSDNLYDVGEIAYPESAEYSDRGHLFLQRMIQYFEHLGFDGFHYVNNFEDGGHVSYIPFRPESIIRLDLPSMLRSGPCKTGVVFNNDFFPERDLTPNESCFVKFERIYREENDAHKLFLLNTSRSSLLRPSSFRQILTERSYYTKVLTNDFIPRIRPMVRKFGIGADGVARATQKGALGIDLSLAVHQDPLPVLLAAGLSECIGHDIVYNSSWEGTVRKFLTDNYPQLFPQEIEDIVYSIKDRFIGMTSTNLINACSWDADRVFAVWHNSIELPVMLSTPYGKLLSSLSRSRQQKYISDQKDNLDKVSKKSRLNELRDKLKVIQQKTAVKIFKTKERR